MRDKKKIIISGGKGMLAKELVCQNLNRFDMVPIFKEDMDITNIEQIEYHVKKHDPDIFLHAAALTNPMKKHEEYPDESIQKNILGTANVAIICHRYKKKLVYISTDYVYSYRKEGNNLEDDPLDPINNYGWSKLGGECAVRILEKYLILRCSFTKRPFMHQKAFVDSHKSYLYVDEIAPIILSALEKNLDGIYNIGGESKTIYEFALQSNPKVGKISRREIGSWVPKNISMNVEKMKRDIL